MKKTSVPQRKNRTRELTEELMMKTKKKAALSS
jgi:hypothetical protein